MKRIIVSTIIILLIMSTAVFAAGKVEQGPEKIVLDFPSWQAEEGGFAVFWKEMIKQFEESHPNVEIELSQVPFAQYHDTLITRFSAGDPPDIVHIASRFFDQFAAQGWFANLDGYFANTDILENWTALQSSMVFDGKNEGLLIMGYGYVFYYNEKIFQEAGIKVPRTKDELLVAIGKIESLGMKDVHAYGITTQQHSNVYQEFCSFVYGSGSTFVKDGEYNFKDPKVIQAAKDYRYVSSFAPKGVSTEMLRQLFIDGKVAMLIDGPWVAAILEDASDELRPYLKLDRTPFAVSPGSISNSLHIAEDASPEIKELVFEFIEQVAKPENQILYSELTKSPAGRSTIAADMQDPTLKLVNDLAADSVSILPDSSNLMMEYSKYVDTCVDAFLKIQYSTDPVEKVLMELEQALLKENLRP